MGRANHQSKAVRLSGRIPFCYFFKIAAFFAKNSSIQKDFSYWISLFLNLPFSRFSDNQGTVKEYCNLNSGSDPQLIVKRRNPPRILRQVRALKSRIPSHHPQFTEISQNETRRSSGFKGEESLDYFFTDLASEKDYFIYHDLRLPLNNTFFQMDTLIMTRRFLLIIEVKNMAGTLYFDPVFEQLIRTLNGREEGFLDPIAQVRRQKKQLTRWMDLHQLPPIPIEFMVAISNPSTIIRTEPGNFAVPQRVAHIHQVPERIQTIRSTCSEEKMTLAELKKIGHYLIKYHTPSEINILKMYQITEDDLITGVHCPSCRAIPMNRTNGTWRCPSCGCKSKNAHVQALHDYFLLISPAITNEEFRKWTHLKSSKTAYKLLQNMNLPVSGNNRCRLYHQPTGFDK
ncbi:nuclease-related domain-containing protein [Sporolactobacillus putidus]|nr:nuclease-related domain-containing protein [Sporolactobacillus putidus]